MGASKDNEKEFAKHLYLYQNLNQKEIAIKVGVGEKTVGKWIETGNWKSQRTSLLSTRTNIVAKLEQQLTLWQDAIEKRDDKLASAKEADLLIKLASAIKKLETEIGVGETITVSMKLINFIKDIDFELSKRLTTLIDIYIQNQLKNG